MTRPQAIWSPEARADLDEIWNYHESVAGTKIAELIVRRIGEVIATIEDHPLAGRSREEIRGGLRSLAATPHVVFYRIRNNAPEIVRILDSRRDIDEIFSE